MPPGQAFDPARTRTEPMLPEHLARTRTEAMLPELASRTKTEPMPEPEPRLPRTPTRIGKLALPPRALEPSGTKTT
jgi:hypothetical protein